MRKAFCLLLILTSFFSKSQTPQRINYQAVARDAGGNIITTAIGVKFEIFQGSLSGTLVYDEAHTITPSSVGIFTAGIGAGAPITGTFGSINWANGPYFLRVNIDPAGGSSYSTVGASQLVSVPYALYAETAGNAATYNAGAGIAVTSGSIINTAPNQTVNISGPGVTGTYPNYTIAPGTALTPGTGISISTGTITNTAPDQTVNIGAAGVATVMNSYPNFTVDVPAPSLTFNGGTKELTLTQGSASTTATLTGTGSSTISMAASGIASVNPTGAGNSFTVSVSAPVIIGQGGTIVSGSWPNYTITSTNTTFSAGPGISIASGSVITNTAPNQTVSIVGVGSTTVTGTYPNFTIAAPVQTVTPPPVISGLGIATVTPAGNNFTVNVAPVSLTYVPGTGILNYSPAPGIQSLNITPALSFTNNVLTVGSNSINVPGTGLWSRPSTTVTALANSGDFVGIGGSFPTAKLSVFGSNSGTSLFSFSGSPETGIRIDNSDLTNNNFSSIAFTTFNSGFSSFEAAKIVGVNIDHTSATQGGELVFMTRSPANIFERMRITAQGNVGIGTSTPGQLLHLFSSGTNVGLVIDGGAAGRARLGFLAGGVDNGEIGYRNDLTFGSISNSSLVMTTEWMRITSTGNVGIGTTSPTELLHVNSRIRITDGFQAPGKVLTSDAAGVSKWEYPLPPSKVGSTGASITVANTGAYTYYTTSPLLVITPAVSGVVILNFNCRYNFNISLPSQIQVGLHINNTGVPPTTSSGFTVGSNVGWAVAPTGGGSGDFPVSFFHNLTVVAGTTYYIWFGGLDLNYNQSATLSAAKIVATLHGSSGL